MAVNLLLGGFMMLLTAMIHGVVTRIILKINERKDSSRGEREILNKLIWLVVIVLLLLIVTMLDSVLWMSCYMQIGAFSLHEEALYFSIVTFSTLGYGDVILNEEWRLLASVQALNGVIILGWTTALLLATVQRIHVK